MGVGATFPPRRQRLNQPAPPHPVATTAANLHLCFQSLPGCSSRNSFLFKFLHCCPGVGIPPRSATLKFYLKSPPWYPASPDPVGARGRRSHRRLRSYRRDSSSSLPLSTVSCRLSAAFCLASCPVVPTFKPANLPTFKRSSMLLATSPRTSVESSCSAGERLAPSPISGPAPAYEDYTRCIHCGLCLNACPTYRLWNLEADSPRGRIHQMFHAFQSEVSAQTPQASTTLGDSFVDHIDKCLDCRACETACPSGVEYGKLVEHARARIEREYERSWIARATRNFIFGEFLSAPHYIEDAGRLFRLYQRSGLQAIARGIGILKLLGLAERDQLLPRIDNEFFFGQMGKTFPT